MDANPNEGGCEIGASHPGGLAGLLLKGTADFVIRSSLPPDSQLR